MLLLLLAISVNSHAQTTISYGQISSYCPQTGDMLGGGAAVAITFYDGYILHPLYGRLNAAQRNSDGSTTYVPSGMAGTPAVQLNAVLVSANRQRMEERITSTMGYMSLNMINTYSSMGEDGGRAAKVGWTPRPLQEEEVQDRAATTTVRAGHAAEREYLKDQTLEDQEHRG